MKVKKKNNRFIASVKVGPKGQIVIPKEVRDLFAISPGDTLILLADSEKGIALQHYSIFSKIADAILSHETVVPDVSEKDSVEFAEAVKNLEDSDR